MMRLDQLGLTVALHAGDAQDLALATLEATRSLTTSVAMVDDREVSTVSTGRPGWRRSLLHAQVDRAPDHERRELGLGRRRRRASPTTLPRRMTVMRSADGRTSRSLWVMKTIDVPSALQRRMITEELVGLLRGQHRRRLVEDQHPRRATAP
jgi:hypothetical protein